jgi:murein DD-endopeptidase MepM/ murein hydrolase activator NlpD
MSKTNRFYTILVIPEKTSQVRRLVIPSWVFRGALVGLFFAVALGTIMMLDYWYVMSQITENKQLKLENRRLSQQVQIFKNKMATIESTMDRVKTFATRLKVITNIEDRGGLLQSLNQKLPDAATNIGATAAPATPTASAEGEAEGKQPEQGQATNAPPPGSPLLAAMSLPQSTPGGAPRVVSMNDGSPESALLRREYQEMDTRFSEMNHEAVMIEQTLQDQYELLADQKAFLSALPTKKPVVGYFTSGFGVRSHPFGGRAKMHEGLDIANHPGTPVKAPADGIIVFASTKAGYGQTVIVDHGYGLETWYGHTKKVLVTKGQRVRRGDPIALLGNTGRSTGPHLHYEVRIHGTPVDPLSYILEN